MGLIQEISRNGALDEAKAKIELARAGLLSGKVEGFTTNVFGTDQQATAYYDADDVEEIFDALLRDIEGLKE